MFTNNIKSDWKSDTPIPFNQATGTELRTLYQRDLKKLQAEQLEAKQEFTKITKDLAIIKQTLAKKRQDLALQNQPQIKKNLQKEINTLSQKKKEIVNEFENTKETLEQLKEEISDLKGALERLNTDLKIDAELETNGYFGSSRLGQCMSAVVQTAALPLTIMLEVATRHPFIVGGMIIANQMFSTAAATLTTTPANTASANTNETATTQTTATQTTATQTTATRENATSSTPNNTTAFNTADNAKTEQVSLESTNATSYISQPTLTSDSPIKISDCLYDFRTKSNATLESGRMVEVTLHKIVSRCLDKEVHGYVKKHCSPYVGQNSWKTWNPFTLNNQDDFFTIETTSKGYCKEPIFEGKPPIEVNYCLEDYITPKDNNTTIHRIINRCSIDTRYGYVKKGCSAEPSDPDDLWNRFKLHPLTDEHTILIHNKKGCEQPIREGIPPTLSYTKNYCPTKNDSLIGLPEVPKPAKIIAGEALQVNDARHLVYVYVKDFGYCTGSLISDRHVLTAAHCVKERKAYLRANYLDKIKIKHDPHPAQGIQYKPTNEYTVSSGHIAPCYHNIYQENCDLALLTLENPIKNGEYLSLPTDSDICEFAQAIDKVLVTDTAFPYELSYRYDRDQEIWKEGNTIIQGFGKEKNAQGNLVQSQTARHGNVVAFFVRGNNGSIVTTPTNKGTDTSFGDSGSPLIFKTKQGKKVQLGVDCCSSKFNGLEITFYASLHNNIHRKWLEKSIKENSTSTKFPSGDLGRLRFSPDSCVEKSDQPDDFLSWLTSLLSSTQGRRKLTFTNLCHDKNHPSKVNIKFYSSYTENGKSKEKLETIYGIESATQVVTFTPGETRVFHTNGTSIKTLLSWSDIDAKIGIKQDTSNDYA